MADAASDEPVRAEHDGVTVEKSYEPDDFPVPAIAFTIRSERDESVSIRLVDSVPEDVPTEDVGFHPKYGAEFWEVDGSTIVFTREFEPHEEYVTVYGLRGKDASEVERFLTEPELESVDPIDGDSGDVVRDVLADDDDDGPATGVDVGESPGVDERDADADDDPDLDIDLPDPNETDDAADSTTTASDAEADDDIGSPVDDERDTEPTADSTSVSEPTAVDADGSLAAALAAEIREGEVDDADLEELRNALGVTVDDSTDARIEHLQSTVADLEAYTEALESFLDEEGDAQSLIEDVREDYETATDRIEDVEAEIDALWAEVDEDLEAELDDVRDEIDAVREDLEDATEERLDALEDDLVDLESELADVAEMRDRLASALGGLGGGATGGGSESDGSSDPADDDEDEEEELDLGD